MEEVSLKPRLERQEEGISLVVGEMVSAICTEEKA